MAKHGCCVDKKCDDDTCMALPEGKTCGDCRHARRCFAMFGHTATDTYCDFYPRRFLEPVAPPTEDLEDEELEDLDAVLGHLD
jgi:hypothetical protein